MAASVADDLIDNEASVEEARSTMFEHLTRGRSPIRTAVGVDYADPELQTRAIGDAIYSRMTGTAPQGAARGLAHRSMLDLMEQFPLGRYGLHSVDALHVMIEAKKLAYADMLRWVGDGRFGPAPVTALLDKARATTRARLIDSSTAAANVEPAVLDGVTNRAGGDTVYLCAIDRHGNIASLIQSIFGGFGSGLVPAGTGFALHNRGALFTLEPGHPNVPAPGKRPLSSMSPTVVVRDGRVAFVAGSNGGPRIITSVLLSVLNALDFGMDVAEAVSAPRFHHQWLPDRVSIEQNGVTPEIAEELKRMGHTVNIGGRQGTAHSIMIDAAGRRLGAPDPRDRDAGAVGN